MAKFKNLTPWALTISVLLISLCLLVICTFKTLSLDRTVLEALRPSISEIDESTKPPSTSDHNKTLSQVKHMIKAEKHGRVKTTDVNEGAAESDMGLSESNPNPPGTMEETHEENRSENTIRYIQDTHSDSALSGQAKLGEVESDKKIQEKCVVGDNITEESTFSNSKYHSTLETALLGRVARRICKVDDFTNASFDHGKWASIPKSTRSSDWLGGAARELYQTTLRPCYKRFGLKYPDFCNVEDTEALQIYIPPDCALPAINATSFQGRRIIMVGDSVMRSASIGLVALLTEAWGYPYDVMVSKSTKQDKGVCSGWASTGTTVCWVNYKTPNFGHDLPTILGQILSATSADDVVLLNFGIHYRISPGPFDHSMKQLQALLHAPGYSSPSSLVWVETEPQFFFRGVYTPPDESSTSEDQGTCHALDVDTWENTSKLANRYNDRLRERLNALQREKLLQIAPVWDAFARLGPRDVLGRRVSQDGKLDCTHSCLMKEKHLYRIQQIQIVLDSKPPSDPAKQEEKVFHRQWGKIQAEIFGGDDKDILSYGADRAQTSPTNKCRQDTSRRTT